MTDTREAFSVRLPAPLHQELRLLKLFTDTPLNTLVVGLLEDYMEREGRAEITRGMTRTSMDKYAEAFKRLAARA